MDIGWYIADTNGKSLPLALPQAGVMKLFRTCAYGGSRPSFFKLDFHVKIDQ